MTITLRYIALLALLFALCGIAYAIKEHTRPANFAASKQRFIERIRTIGGRSAFEEFLRDTSSMKPFDAHTMAHVFGEALYAAEGIDGFADCRDDYQHGCVHQFVASAVVDHGLDVVNTLHADCRKLPRDEAVGCEHGLGHGLLAYYGYEQAGVEQALDECLAITDRPRSYCADGALMEYNLREMATLTTKNAFEPRSYVEAQRMTPCTELKDEYGSVCAFQLPIWWTYAMGGSVESRYRRMGLQCRESGYIRPCFEGIGFATLDTDPKDPSLLCSYAAVDGAEHTYCLTGIVRRKSIGIQSGSTICDQLSMTGASRAYCYEYASIDPELSETLPAFEH